MSFASDADPGFADPGNISEVYVEEIGDLQIVAGLIKITLVVARLIDGAIERYATCRIVAPLPNAKRMHGQVDAAIKGLPFMSEGIEIGTVPN